MERGAALLGILRGQMQRWADHIHRCTKADVTILPPESGGTFEVVLYWSQDSDTVIEYVKCFTRPMVFGRTYTLSPQAWMPEKKACEYARDIIREVLQKRGVI